MVDASLAGRTFPATAPFEVTTEHVAAFAAATGTPYAEGDPAPATYPIVVAFAAMQELMADPTFGISLHHVVHGQQKFAYERPVRVGEGHKSVSAERTFDVDYREESDLRREVTRVAGLAWTRIARAGVTGRTVTLKVKFADFQLITRSKSFPSPINGLEAFEAAGQALLGQLLPVPKGIRLPMTWPSEASQAAVDAALSSAGIA